jgi:hypothetical protein
MNSISAALRIICGVALIIFSYWTYHRISQHVAAGQPIEAFGVSIGASPGQVTFALGVFGLIGVLLIVLGVITFFKKRA